MVLLFGRLGVLLLLLVQKSSSWAEFIPFCICVCWGTLQGWCTFGSQSQSWVLFQRSDLPWFIWDRVSHCYASRLSPPFQYCHYKHMGLVWVLLVLDRSQTPILMLSEQSLIQRRYFPGLEFTNLCKMSTHQLSSHYWWLFLTKIWIESCPYNFFLFCNKTIVWSIFLLK